MIAGKSVYIDTATISAPLIQLTPVSAGSLNAVYVNEGDTVAANTPVAEVGTEIITTKVAGTIVQVTDTIGAHIAPGESVVEMIDPSQLRVVGKIDETKGLSEIQIGDSASFTVDAFGSKSFTGVVDEIAPTVISPMSFSIFPTSAKPNSSTSKCVSMKAHIHN